MSKGSFQHGFSLTLYLEAYVLATELPDITICPTLNPGSNVAFTFHGLIVTDPY